MTAAALNRHLAQPWGMSQLMNWTIALVWPGIVAVFLVLLLLTESSAKAGAAALNTQQQV